MPIFNAFEHGMRNWETATLGLGKIWERSQIRRMAAKSHRISGPRCKLMSHNPKVVSSNLTPATISKACLRIGLRDEERANWNSQFVAQFAQRVSPTGSSILNSHLLVLCPRCVPPCPRTDQRISSVGAISCLPVIRPELGRTIPSRIKSNFPQRDFSGGYPKVR
jgi:hypothetical protein